MAIDLTWPFIWRSPFARLVIADVHLFVAFVAMERSAKRFGRGITRCFQLRQGMQQHIDLEPRPFIRRLGLIELADKLRQHVSPKVYQKIPCLDRLPLFSRWRNDGA